MYKQIPKHLRAMPMVIPQDDLNIHYIQGWVDFIRSKIRNGTVTVVKTDLLGFTLFLVKKSETSGCYFLSRDLEKIEYLYAYSSVKVSGQPRAAEALAYLFNPTVRGVTKEILFDHLIPKFKFLVTDSLYTPDGERWFHSAYNHALNSPGKYEVYALDLKRKLSLKIGREEFDLLTPSFWGRSSSFQTYRFAIALK